MDRKFLHDLVLLDPEAAGPRRAGVLVARGRIEAVLEEGERPPADAERHDLSGLALAPGFIDLHFHGELVFAGDHELPDTFARTARSLLAEGTTAYLATTVAWERAKIDIFLTHAEAEMTLLRRDGASMLGVHLEGPWINPAAAGAQPMTQIRPYDAAEGREILARGQNLLAMVTFAPETPGGAKLLDALVDANLVASLGHSLVGHEEIDAFVTQGMTHVTHLFNAMGTLHHRDPGVAGHVLADDRMTADLICDGVHVHPKRVVAAARAKGDRLLLVSDRIEPPGVSRPGSRVRRADGAALPPDAHAEFGSGPVHNDGAAIRMADGTLAGSTLTLARALANAQAFGAMTRLEAVAALTLRPARLLGRESERGTLRPGARADFAVLDPGDQVRETWIAGERVYRA